MSIEAEVIGKAADTVKGMHWFKTLRFGEVLLLIVVCVGIYFAYAGIPAYLAQDREARQEQTKAFTDSLKSQQDVFERTLDRYDGKTRRINELEREQTSK